MTAVPWPGELRCRETERRRPLEAAHGAVTPIANTAGLIVTLDLGVTGRTTVQCFVSVGGPTTVFVQGSRDGATWRTVESQTFTVANTNVPAVQGFGYRFIRVTSGSAGIALEFEISAAALSPTCPAPPVETHRRGGEAG